MTCRHGVQVCSTWMLLNILTLNLFGEKDCQVLFLVAPAKDRRNTSMEQAGEQVAETHIAMVLLGFSICADPMLNSAPSLGADFCGSTERAGKRMQCCKLIKRRQDSGWMENLVFLNGSRSTRASANL
jgi:hypothetical protein